MNKEIEEWIEQNNPIKTINEDVDVLLHDCWEAGAKAMAEHLQSQPPTKEQIAGVLQYVYNEILPEEDMTTESIGYMVEDVLNKWSDE